MKKTIILFLSLLLGVFTYAQQVSRDMVIVEGGTGFW